MGWVTALLDILYLASLANVLRTLFLTAFTDPGIIPKIRSSEINYNRTYSVAYRSPDEIDYDHEKSAGANFFALRQFKLKETEES